MVNWRRQWGQSVMKLIWDIGFPDIYAQLGGVNLLWVYMHCAIYETHFVSWFCRDICLIGGRGGKSVMGIYALFYIYLYIRCAKFGVAVFKASMLDWGVGSQSAMGICALFYIYIYIRSAIRCDTFGVVAFKASMLDWRRGWGSICHRYM